MQYGVWVVRVIQPALVITREAYLRLYPEDEPRSASLGGSSSTGQAYRVDPAGAQYI